MPRKSIEDWRFNLGHAKAWAASLSCEELQAQFARHLNYIPGSSYTSVMRREMVKRGMQP